MLNTISSWLKEHKLYTGLTIGSICFLLFLLVYFYTNIAYVNYYGGAASCTNSTRTGILLTAPVNYCEDRIGYATFQQGIDANMAITAVIIFAAVVYSWNLETRFKKYLSFKMALVVSIASTYILSILNLLVSGRPAGGTSIIGFDMLLFMLLGLVVDYSYMASEGQNKVAKLKNGLLARFVIAINRLAKKTVSEDLAARRAYNTLKGLYWIGIFGLAGMLLLGYIPTASAPFHLAGGFLLLLYVFLANRKKLAFKENL